MQYVGLGTALLTPFKNNGKEVDFEQYAALVRRQMEAGVDFLVPLGTTGETPCLTAEEKIAILQTTKANANCPVVVGVGTNSLEGTLASIRLLEPYGPDAYLVVTPYYNKPTQEGLYQYFHAVAAATEKNIILYNVPGRTGVNLEAETTLRLARDVKNIVAVKEASGRYAQISRIVRDCPEDFTVLSGNDDETLSLMATGADGVISVASNIDPVRMTALVQALMRDDLTTSRELHHLLSPLFHACFVESNPIPAKAAMNILGLMENSLRLPLVPASEQTSLLLRNTLQTLF